MAYTKVTFLGTGTSQGIPVIGCDCPVCKSMDFRDQRLRTSAFIEVGDVKILIDTGPDFRMQALRNNIDDVDAILYTHQHKDHTGGLDDLRPIYFKRDKKPISIYAKEEVIHQLKKEYEYMFREDKYPSVPDIDVNLINGQPFSIRGIEIVPIRVNHYLIDIYGFRIGGLVYITDAKAIDESEIKKVLGCDVLVVNALQREKHISHFTLEESMDFARKVNAPKTYFTHISHRLGNHLEVEKELDPSMKLAYDGLTLDIG